MAANVTGSMMPQALTTPRLRLRTIAAGDTEAVEQLAGDWDVARMLADMPHPMTRDIAAQWVSSAVTDRCLAITLAGRMIGSVAVCWPDPGVIDARGATPHGGPPLPPAAELGFWLGREWWGRGYAREAAGAVMADILGPGKLTVLRSGHFVDNPASGRVLSALGFGRIWTTKQWCLARRQVVAAERYEICTSKERAADIHVSRPSAPDGN